MAKEEAKKEMVASEGARRLMPFVDADRWFDDFFRRPFSTIGFPRFKVAAAEEIVPDVDMFEDGGDVVVKAEIPGMKKEDIDVTLTDGAITISGEKKKEQEIKKKNYYKWERSYGSFCRTLSLPAEIQADKVKSTFKDGVLEIRMPKTEQAKSKEVKVKVD
jgi:HSP20 family protein